MSVFGTVGPGGPHLRPRNAALEALSTARHCPSAALYQERESTS